MSFKTQTPRHLADNAHTHTPSCIVVSVLIGCVMSVYKAARLAERSTFAVSCQNYVDKDGCL